MSKIEQQLQDLGFKEFDNILKKYCEKSYQLRVRDKDGSTKYFVNVDLYDYNSFTDIANVPDMLKEDMQADYEVQFHYNGDTFDVNYNNQCPHKALEFFEKVFVSMGCEMYD